MSRRELHSMLVPEVRQNEGGHGRGFVGFKWIGI